MEQELAHIPESKDLGNLHLRHAMLAAVHSVLKNYMLCMDRNYFGTRSKEEIELTNNLRGTMQHVETVMSKYFNLEGELVS